MVAAEKGARSKARAARAAAADQAEDAAGGDA
jgi:hypothetical protein